MQLISIELLVDEDLDPSVNVCLLGISEHDFAKRLVSKVQIGMINLPRTFVCTVTFGLV
jgi:hypothetical protein